MSDEAGVRACKAFVSRLCMGAGAWEMMWVDISSVVYVHGKCALENDCRLRQRLPGATLPHNHSVQCAVFEVIFTNTTWATVMLRLFCHIADDNDTPAHHEHVNIS